MDKGQSIEELIDLLSLTYELVKPIGNNVIEIADKKSSSMGFYDVETKRLEAPKYRLIHSYEKYSIMQDQEDNLLIYYRDLDEIHPIIQCYTNGETGTVGVVQIYKGSNDSTNPTSPFKYLTINRIKIIDWNSRYILITSDTVKSEIIIFDTVEKKEVYRDKVETIRISTNRENLFCISFLDPQTNKYTGVSNEGTFEIIEDYIHRKFKNGAIKKQPNKGYLITEDGREYTYNKYGQLY